MCGDEPGWAPQADEALFGLETVHVESSQVKSQPSGALYLFLGQMHACVSQETHCIVAIFSVVAMLAVSVVIQLFCMFNVSVGTRMHGTLKGNQTAQAL